LTFVGAPGAVKQNSSRASVNTPMNSRPHAEIASVVKNRSTQTGVR